MLRVSVFSEAPCIQLGISTIPITSSDDFAKEEMGFDALYASNDEYETK